MHITKQIEDGYLGSGVYINRAIRKYGKHNFTRQILAYANSEQELIQLEKQYVTQQILHDDNCYNLNVGGSSWYYVNKFGLNRGGLKHKLQNDVQFRSYYCNMISTRQKEYHKTHSNAFKGKHHSIASKQLIKKHHADCSGKKNSQFGTHWYCNRTLNKNLKLRDGDTVPDGFVPGMIRPEVSKQSKAKMSIAKKGKKLSNQTKKKMSGKIPWNKGKKRTVDPLSGKICINNQYRNKFIYPQELPKYESQGWQKGMCNNHNWKNPDMVRTKIKESLKRH